MRKNKLPYFYGFILLIVLLGGIVVAKEAEIWQVSGKLNPDGSKVVIQGKDVSEVKGWSKFGDVITAFELDKDEVFTHFNITDESYLEMELKDLAALTNEGISPSIMKEYISEVKGLDYSSEEKEEKEEKEG